MKDFQENPKLRELVEGVTTSIYWSIDPVSFKFNFSGKNLATILGRESSSISEILHPADMDYFLTSIQLLDRSDRQIFQHRFLHNSGHSLWFQSELWTSESGEEIFGVSFATTDLKASLTDKRISQILDISTDLICVAGTDGYFKEINKAFETMLGYSEKELLESQFLSFIHPEDLESTIECIKDLQNGKAVTLFENRYRKKDGTYIWLTWTSQPIPNTHFIYAIARDVTEKKENLLALEELVKEKTFELQRSNEFLDLVLENVPHMVFVKDAKDLRFVHFNRAGEEMLGFRRDELIGKNDYDFFPAEQADFFTSKDRMVLEGKVVVEISEEQISTKYGEKTVRTKKIPLLGTDGEPKYLLGFSEDITEWKNAENQRLELVREQIRIKERASSREKTIFLANAHNILASSLDYHITLDKLAKIMIPFLGDWCTITISNQDGTCSRAAAHHKDPEKKYLMDELMKFTPKINSEDSTFKKVLVEGKSVMNLDVTQDALHALAMNDNHLDVINKLGCHSSMTIPIVYRDKIHGAIAIVISDNTRTLTAQDLSMAEELGMRAGVAIENALLYQTAQKAISVRDEFLSIASHELKTPVTALKLLLQMTRKGINLNSLNAPTPQKLAVSLDKANHQVNRLTNLIEDLLDTSRIDMGKIQYNFQLVNLSEIVREMCDSYYEHLRSCGCELNLRIQENILVMGDRMRLEQVVLNMLTNAAKYGEQKPVTVTLLNKNGYAELSIKDQGMGITQEKIDRVFDRFERAISAKNISGLGLGLFISKEIIKAHNGRIWVESKLYEGANFIVELQSVSGREPIL